MPVEAFGLTHVGSVRTNNEDALAIVPDLSVAIVADGMGGANCGEVASALTIKGVTGYLADPAETSLSPGEMLMEAVRTASRSVWNESQNRSECDGMGSTIVLAHWHGNRFWIANVGDSRAYLWRNSVLRQLSYDQNLANDLRTKLGLSEEQIRRYPHHATLTMAIGIAPEVLIRSHQEDLVAGDVILLCSDGLHGPVGDEGIAKTLTECPGLTAAAARLVDQANDAGGPDNITVALLRYYES